MKQATPWSLFTNLRNLVRINCKQVLLQVPVNLLVAVFLVIAVIIGVV